MKNTARTNLKSVAARTLALATLVAASIIPAAAQTPPSIEQYAVPSTLHDLQATVTHSKADMDVLRKIGPGFADGYRVTSATYIYTAPDRLEVHAHAGIISASQIYTNTTRRTDFGFIHKTDDISKDITRRLTIFVLGVLPQNYLDTMRSDYIDAETVNGIDCDVFMLRYITDRPKDNRRFEVWISKTQHYVVQKRVWDGGNNEHETVDYSKPIEALPGVWIPTQVEAYDPQGELGGIAQQKDITAHHV